MIKSGAFSNWGAGLWPTEELPNVFQKNTLLYTKKQKHLCSVPSNEGRAEVTHDIMDINKILSKLFGNKSSRDMKAIQPWVEKIKAAYPTIQALDNDGLRAKTKEWQEKIQHSADDIKEKIEALKAKVEETPIEDREVIFNQIDKLETQVLDKMEEALNEALPEVLAIVKDTARRFAENETVEVTANDFDRELATSYDFVTIEGDKAIYQNHWIAGGNDTKWNMVHYDVQLFGGVVLHQGKIAEMATGEGKTLVGTLPRILECLDR